MKQLIQTLREAKQQGTEQTKYVLANFDEEGFPYAYCVLGYLRCRKKQLTIEEAEGISVDMYGESILDLYDVPADLFNIDYSTELDAVIETLDGDRIFPEHLEQLFYILNDRAGFTFDEIADYMEATFGDCT